MDCLLFVFVLGTALISSAACGIREDTLNDCVVDHGFSYTGTTNHTASGTDCQRWDLDIPHKPKLVPKDGTHHNYCRNPDRDEKGPWCYSTDPSRRWEYCNIKKCDTSFKNKDRVVDGE